MMQDDLDNPGEAPPIEGTIAVTAAALIGAIVFREASHPLLHFLFLVSLVVLFFCVIDFAFRLFISVAERRIDGK